MKPLDPTVIEDKKDILALVSGLFIDSVDIEIVRYQGDKEVIISGLADIFFSYQFHTFFVPRNIEDLKKKVLTNVKLRPVLLDITARFITTCALSNLSYETIVNCFSNIPLSITGYSNKEIAEEILSVPIFLTLKVNKEDAVNTLMASPWLMTILLILMFFQNSIIYNEVIKARK